MKYLNTFQFLSISILLTSTVVLAQVTEINVVNAFPELTFDSPIYLTHSNDSTNRLFVVEKEGVIKVFENYYNVSEANIFLDIRDRVRSLWEEGLLGLAFHPNFKSNRYFYVHYVAGSPATSDQRSVISRFSADSSGTKADSTSEFILFEVDHPENIHFGGMLEFGPNGYLYISLGDGGPAGDPNNNGQNLMTLSGSILCIDVNSTGDTLNYVIPSDNPFVGNTQGYREEIWAYGFRNTWRFSLDEVTGQFWGGDVGQNWYEEINLIEKGNNYGWHVMEGFHCFRPPVGCDTTGKTLPIVEYIHGPGYSVTGGYVYRGSAFPIIYGAYIYGDFVTGNIWLLRYENDEIIADSLLVETNLNISSFGIDENNELYILNFIEGNIYKLDIIVSVEDDFSSRNNPQYFHLNQNYPNPFNPTTTVTFFVPYYSHIKLDVFDVLGNKVVELINEELPAGNYNVEFNAQNLTSGVYFYRLQAGDFSSIKKLILLK